MERQLEILQRRAEEGDAWTLTVIGWRAYEAKDYTEAVKWYRRAADMGLSWVQFRLGYCYEWGLGTDCDTDEANRLYDAASAQGLTEEQRCIWRKEMDRARDRTERMMAAADRNDAEAAYLLYVLDGFKLPEVQKEKYLSLAVSLDYLPALFCMGERAEDEQAYSEAFGWFCRAAEIWEANRAEHADYGEAAAMRVARYYNEGLGVDACLEEARRRWEVLSAHPERAKEIVDKLNVMDKWALIKQSYEEGDGWASYDTACLKDTFSWVKRAAEYGVAEAQFLRGLACIAAEEEEEAACWFKRASAQGHANSTYYLGKYYKARLRDKRNSYKALNCIASAAERGNKLAMYETACCFFDGTGMGKPNPKRAYHWFRKAAQLGHEEAAKRLAEMQQSATINRLK